MVAAASAVSPGLLNGMSAAPFTAAPDPGDLPGIPKAIDFPFTVMVSPASFAAVNLV